MSVCVLCSITRLRYNYCLLALSSGHNILMHTYPLNLDYFILYVQNCSLYEVYVCVGGGCTIGGQGGRYCVRSRSVVVVWGILSIPFSSPSPSSCFQSPSPLLPHSPPSASISPSLSSLPPFSFSPSQMPPSPKISGSTWVQGSQRTLWTLNFSIRLEKTST